MIHSMNHVFDIGFTFSGFPCWSMDTQEEAVLGCPGWLPGQAECSCVTDRAAWFLLPASASPVVWRLDLQQQETPQYVPYSPGALPYNWFAAA